MIVERLEHREAPAEFLNLTLLSRLSHYPHQHLPSLYVVARDLRVLIGPARPTANWEKERRLEAEGMKLDEPVRKGSTGNTITYITDPWGTHIEIVQRLLLGPQVSTN